MAVVRRKGHRPITKTFRLKTQAEQWARGVETDIDDSEFIDQKAASKITVNELLSQYEKRYITTSNESNRLRGKSHLPALRRIREAFGHMVLSAVTPEKITAYKNERLEGTPDRRAVASSTVRHELNLLSALIKMAREDGIKLPVNPVREVKMPKQAKGRERRLEGDELDRLLDAAPSIELWALITVAVETAARLGELLSLRWCDVDLEKRTAYIEVTKNDESRTLPLSSRAIIALNELEPNEFKDRVFWRWERSDSFNKMWARTCARAGVKGLHFHDLRHEAISRLAESGKFNLIEIAAISGHKTLTMLKRYSHIRPETLAAKLG